MIVKNTFAEQFGKIAQATGKAAFEVRFNSVQNGLIRQLNKKIDGVNQDGVQRDVERLQKQRDKAAELGNSLRDLQFDIKTNALRFLVIRDRADAAIAGADADADGTLSDDEVTALNDAIANITPEIYKLKFTHQYPEFTDGNLANRMRGQASTLSGLTAEAGIIDDAAADPQTNDNQSILATLKSISNQANTFADSSTVLVGSINQQIIDTDKKAYDLEADVASLTAGEMSRRDNEVEDLKIRYGNLIRSISLAFEVQSSFSDSIANGTTFKPEKGSILNLFT